MAGSDSVLSPLKGKSSTLLYLAAGLLIVVAGLFALSLESSGPLLGTLAPAGFGFACLGLLGLYPTLVDRSPRLARAGAIFLGIGVAGALILVVGNAGELAGLYAKAPAWLDAANLLLIIGGVTLGFGIFGVGVLRTGTYSRSVGLLMLWPPVVFGVIVIIVATLILGLTLPHWIHAADSGALGLVFLGIGYLVRPG